MSNARKFAKNSLALTIASLSVTFLGAVYRILIARYLGDAEFGKYTFITTYVAYFSALSLFGLRSVVIREVARDFKRRRSILRQALVIRGVTTLLAFTSAYFIVLFKPHTGADVYEGVLVYAISLFALAAMDIIEGMIVAREASVYITYSAIISNVLKIVVGIAALRLGYGLLAILWVFTVISALNALLSWWFFRIAYRNDVVEDDEVSPAKTRRFLIRESLPFFYVSLVSKVYYKNDIMILSVLSSERAVGQYGAAYLPIDALLIVAGSMTSAAYPIMSRMFAGKDGDLKQFHNSLSKYMMLIFLPFALLLTAAGPELMHLVFRGKYDAAGPLLRVLAWMPPAEAVTVGMGTVLAATNNQRCTAKLTVLNASINLSLCLALIPILGGMGGAIGTVVSGYITLIIVMHVVNKKVHKMSWWNILGKPIICSLAALASMAIVMPKHQPWLSLGVSLLTFVAAVVMTKTITRDDINLVGKVLGRSRKNQAQS